MPKALQNKPESDEILDQFLKIFYTLRSRSEQQAPISISEFLAYCNIIGEEEKDTLFDIINTADVLFLNHVRNSKKEAEDFKKEFDDLNLLKSSKALTNGNRN